MTVNFINDGQGGSASTDGNLYVGSIAYDGTVQAGSSVAPFAAGVRAVAFG